MATIFEDLTTQVNGITDTFNSINPVDQGVFSVYNGNGIDKNELTVLTSNSFKLSFVPFVGDTLAIFLTPDVFNITVQVNGITDTFVSDVSDLGEGSFLGILNGQVLVQDTVSLSQTSFKLNIIPQIGDTLEYFRIQKSSNFFNVKVDGFVTQNTINGIIKDNNITGEAKQKIVFGESRSVNSLNGITNIGNKVIGEV